MGKKIFFILLFLVISASQYFFLGSFIIKNDVINNLIVFLTIIFGFYITSLAIFVTSKYVSNLYKITDQQNKSLTLLHTLINNYKTGLVLILSSIFYLLVFQFIFNQGEDDSTQLSTLWSLPLTGIFFFNFLYSYFMMNDLIKIIIQEAKRNS